MVVEKPFTVNASQARRLQALARANGCAMCVWLGRKALAGHGLTVSDIESALRQENVELPAGSIESDQRHFTLRMARHYRVAEDFAQLVVSRCEDGHLFPADRLPGRFLRNYQRAGGRKLQLHEGVHGRNRKPSDKAV